MRAGGWVTHLSPQGPIVSVSRKEWNSFPTQHDLWPTQKQSALFLERAIFKYFGFLGYCWDSHSLIPCARTLAALHRKMSGILLLRLQVVQAAHSEGEREDTVAGIQPHIEVSPKEVWATPLFVAFRHSRDNSFVPTPWLQPLQSVSHQLQVS